MEAQSCADRAVTQRLHSLHVFRVSSNFGVEQVGNDSNVHENMMLPKLDTFVLLTNEGPSLEKDEHRSKNKNGDDGMRKGNKNGVTSDDFRTLKPP